MKKKDIENMLNSEKGEIKIDVIRTLRYEVTNIGFVPLNKFTQKRDILSLHFENNISGSITDRYTLISRCPEEILSEIKSCTELFYQDMINYLNGTKVLAKNW